MTRSIESLRRFAARRYILARKVAELRSTWALPVAAGVLTLMIMVSTGAWAPGPLVAVAIQAGAAAGFVAWQASVARSNLSLLTTVTAFIAEARSQEALDRVLGSMIGRVSNNFTSDEPAGGLFDALDREIPGAPYEFRRRAAEALPTLATINAQRTGELALELREDFDPRYKSDIRRRVIEGLYIRTRQNTPMVSLMKLGDVERLLEPRLNDNFFTILAIVECVFSDTWPRARRGRTARQRILSEVGTHAATFITEEQRAALSAATLIWKTYASGDRSAAEALVVQALADSDRHIPTVGARAAVTLPLGSATTRLDRLADISTNPNKYVRRVAAREVAQEFLLVCLSTRGLRSKAEEILAGLAGDSDHLIRVTLLDCLEFSYDGPRAFRDQLLDEILGWESDPLAIERIRRARLRE